MLKAGLKAKFACHIPDGEWNYNLKFFINKSFLWVSMFFVRVKIMLQNLMKKTLLIIVFSFFSKTVFAEIHKIGILVFDGVLTSDVVAPLEVFGMANKKAWFDSYTVITVAVKNVKEITTEEGLKIGVDSWIGNTQSFDAFVVPSSYAMPPLLDNKRLIEFIKKIDQTADLMMSNCSGAKLLAQSGILDGKEATTWAGGESELQRDYPDVKVLSDKNVVIDGKYITSNGSLVSYEAALIALAKMSSFDNAKEVFDALQMGRMTSWDRISGLVNKSR